MNRVGVIGAGVIGMGVAQSFALKGYEVRVNDIVSEKFDKAKKEIGLNLRFMNMLNKEKVTEDIPKILGRIHKAENLQEISECDFIIENIVENYEAKKEVYDTLNKLKTSNKMYLVNTSCIPIAKIAKLLAYPENVIGVHFMNPVPMKDTVEVIKSKYTSQDCQDKVLKLLESINKKGIIVNDSPGFVSNRLSHLFMNEAACIVEEGVAKIEDVDEISKKCFGHAMGPLETADLIGIDTVVDSIKVLEEYYDNKFKCSKLLLKKVEEGKLGRKTGEGFYQYN